MRIYLPRSAYTFSLHIPTLFLWFPTFWSPFWFLFWWGLLDNRAWLSDRVPQICHSGRYGFIYNLGVLSVCVLIMCVPTIRALLFGVHDKAPDVLEIHMLWIECWLLEAGQSWSKGLRVWSAWGYDRISGSGFIRLASSNVEHSSQVGCDSNDSNAL